MTEIVKLVDAAGAEHWTAEGSPAHERLLAEKEAAANTEEGDAVETEQSTAEEVGDGGQGTAVHREGHDHDATDTSGGSGDRPAGGGAAARGARRSRSA